MQGDISEDVNALNEGESRLLTEMQSVLVINRALVSEIELHNLLEFIIVQAQHLANVDGVAVLLLSEDGKYLEVAQPGKSWLRIQPGRRLLVEGSMAELALAENRVKISNQAENEQQAASICALLQPEKVESVLCAPLTAQNKSLGVLLVWTGLEQMFTPHDSRLMSLFADQAALALQNAYLHERSRQLAVEKERNRLAGELHASVTQSLYSIGLAAYAITKLLEQGLVNEAKESIEYIYSLSQATLAELREQLYYLHPALFKTNDDLVRALSQHCSLLSKQHNLVIDFKAELNLPLSVDQRDTFYFVAKEALWNVIKHAEANRVDIILTGEDHHIMLAVEDDGIGFEPATAQTEAAMGLRSMAERIELMGGIFELRSQVRQGTRLFVRVPIQTD